MEDSVSSLFADESGDPTGIEMLKSVGSIYAPETGLSAGASTEFVVGVGTGKAFGGFVGL